MGMAAASRYTGDTDSQKKKSVTKKPTFPSREEQEAWKRFEERKDKVINHEEESIGEHYTSLRQQANCYAQETRALQFFEPDDAEELACRILAIVNWAKEFLTI